MQKQFFDPLNLTGTLIAGKRVPAIFTNRILFMDGKVVCSKEGKDIIMESGSTEAEQWQFKKEMIQRKVGGKRGRICE